MYHKLKVRALMTKLIMKSHRLPVKMPRSLRQENLPLLTLSLNLRRTRVVKTPTPIKQLTKLKHKNQLKAIRIKSVVKIKFQVPKTKHQALKPRTLGKKKKGNRTSNNKNNKMTRQLIYSQCPAKLWSQKVLPIMARL